MLQSVCKSNSIFVALGGQQCEATRFVAASFSVTQTDMWRHEDAFVSNRRMPTNAAPKDELVQVVTLERNLFEIDIQSLNVCELPWEHFHWHKSGIFVEPRKTNRIEKDREIICFRVYGSTG